MLRLALARAVQPLGRDTETAIPSSPAKYEYLQFVYRESASLHADVLRMRVRPKYSESNNERRDQVGSARRHNPEIGEPELLCDDRSSGVLDSTRANMT